MAKSKMTITIKDEDFDKEIQEYLQTRLRDYAKDQIKPTIVEELNKKIEKEIVKKVDNYLESNFGYYSGESIMKNALTKVTSEKVNEAFDRTWSSIPSKKVEEMITDKINEVFKTIDIERVIQEKIRNTINILIEKNLKSILSPATPDKE